MNYINTLTGLRGLAALIVFISHGANQLMLPAIFGNGLGQLGVMLFFVLSGFLMAWLYLQKPFTSESVSHYIVARVGRIFPLYLLLLLLSVALSSTVYPSFHYHITDMEIILRALLLIDAPYEFWTIPVEVQFYAVFIVFWYLYQRGSSRLLLTGLVVGSCLPTLVFYQLSGRVPALFSTYSLPFFVGIVTALNYSVLQRYYQRYAKWGNGLAAVSLLLLILSLPALRLQQGWALGDHFLLRTWGDPLNWLVVYGLFFCALMNVSALRFLLWRPLVVLGDISFGFYLIHYPVLKIIRYSGLPQELQFIAAFIIVSGLAWLSYRYYEQAAASKIRSAWLNRAPVAAPAH